MRVKRRALLLLCVWMTLIAAMGSFAAQAQAVSGGVTFKETVDEGIQPVSYTHLIARQEIEAYFAGLAKKPVSNWAKEAVEFVQAEGLMNGDTDGNFRPQSPITRQEVAAVLMNEHDK